MTAPQNLLASVSDAGVLLQWADSPDPDFAGFKIYRSTVNASDGSKFFPIGTTDKSEFLDTTAPAGVCCFYRVSAYSTTNVFSGHTDVTATRPTGATPPPTTPPPATAKYAPRPANWIGSLTPPPKLREKRVTAGQDLKAVVGTLVRGDTVLLERGGKYPLKGSGIVVKVSDVHFNAFGIGPNPIIEMDIVSGGTSGSKKSMVAISLVAPAERLFVQNIDFNAVERGFTDYVGVNVGEYAVDCTVDHCNALSAVIDSLTMTNGIGLRTAFCEAPNGVNQYGIFAGAKSSYTEIEGCYINDSKNESCYRCYGKNVRVVGNHFIKRRRQAGGIKCMMRNQYGENHYIAGNRFESPDGQGQMILGPIGTDGTHSSAEKSVNFVMEKNVATGIAQFQFNHGIVNAIIRDNELTWASPTHTGIEVTKWGDAPSRVAPTAVFERNAVKAGSFIVNATAGIQWKGKSNLLNGKPV